MTIVDSINKITESLGGDTTGVQTASEAIDALRPVIGGGGGTGLGSASFESHSHFDEETGETISTYNLISMDGLTSLDTVIQQYGADFQEWGVYIEPAQITVQSYYDDDPDRQYPNTPATVVGEHEFCKWGAGQGELFIYVIPTFVYYGSSAPSFSTTTTILYRSYQSESGWTEWMVYNP